MWINNFNLFLARDPFAFTAAELEEQLAAMPCQPVTGQATSSEGFVAPIKQDGRLVLAVDGWLYCVHQEIVRLLPGGVVNEELQERVEALQQKESRPVGRKEKAELKEQIIFEFLPRAFTRSRQTPVLIDMHNSRLLVGTSSISRADQVVSALRQALGSLPVIRPTTDLVTDSLEAWLKDPQKLPSGLDIGDRCELKDATGEAASMRFAGVDVSSDTVLAHLANMQVTRLNLTLNDAIECDIDQDLLIKRLRPLDTTKEQLQAIEADDATDALLADITLQGGLIRELLSSLGEQLPLRAKD